MSELDCVCGHPQSWHAKGVGRCEHGCGCLRARLHKRGGLEVLEQLDPGRSPVVAPTYKVRCPRCKRSYATKAWLRDIVTRKSCRACADASRTKDPSAGKTRPADLPSFADYPHGVRARYVAGCRCSACREASNAYERMRGKLRRAGEGNPLVPAGRVRRHLQALSRAGVGRGTVADAAHVPRSSIVALASGRKTQLRKHTAARILGVTRELVADGALVDARSTWRAIERLLAQGYSRGAKFGCKRPALQLRKDRVTARTRARVLRLARELLEGRRS